MMQKPGNNEKRYRVIAKVGPDKFVKYNCSNLLSFTKFLDEKYIDWKWFNVYLYVKGKPGEQLASFTNKDRPLKKYI